MKKCNFTNWASCLPLLLIVSNLFGQEIPELPHHLNSVGATISKVVSSECDQSEEQCTGSKIWEDGTKYEGDFQFGKIQGYGTMTYKDGSKYIGDWSNEKREGSGSIKFTDGTEYLGTFKNNRIHGEGAILWSDGTSYSGNWKNGKSHGEGKLTRKDGSQFIGIKKEGVRHGEGIIVWKSGDTLSGNWNEGMMDQEAIFKFANGSSMIRYWENGEMKDKATYIQPNGLKVSASSKQLAKLIFKTSMSRSESIHDHFGLVHYAIGLEFKSMNNYGAAAEQMQLAMQFRDPIESSDIFEMVEIQMASLAEEKENSGLIKAQKVEEEK